MDFKDDYQQKEEAVSVNQNQEQSVQQNSYVEDQSEQGLEEAAWAAKVQGGKEQANKTGIPDALKTKLEQEFGFDLSKVRVHYNSDKPAEIGAYAYAEGYNIYIAAGQESYLEHEVRHVIQQLKGEAKATEEIGGKKVDARKSMEDDADKESVLNTKDSVKENEELKTATPKAVIQGGFWSNLWEAFEEFTYELHPQLRDDFYDDPESTTVTEEQTNAETSSDSSAKEAVIEEMAPVKASPKPKKKKAAPKAVSKKSAPKTSPEDVQLLKDVGGILTYFKNNVREPEMRDKWGEDYEDSIKTIGEAQDAVIQKNPKGLKTYFTILDGLQEALFTDATKAPKTYEVSNLETRVTTPGVGLKRMLKHLTSTGKIKPGGIERTYTSSFDKGIGDFSASIHIENSSSNNTNVVIHAHIAADGSISQAHLKPTNDQGGSGYSLNKLTTNYYNSYVYDALKAQYGANWSTDARINRRR